jgi:hypothetical protein
MRGLRFRGKALVTIPRARTSANHRRSRGHATASGLHISAGGSGKIVPTVTPSPSETRPPWHALAGVIEYWAEEGLRHIGRLRAAGSSKTSAVPIGTVDQEIAAFIAHREPWRASEITLMTNGTGPVIASWSDDATAVIEGVPAQQHIVASNESWGDLGLYRLLNPSWLERLAPKPWPADLSIAGESLEKDTDAAPELFTASTSRYHVAYDPALDIITQWTATIDGAVASRFSLTHLNTLEAVPAK